MYLFDSFGSSFWQRECFYFVKLILCLAISRELDWPLHSIKGPYIKMTDYSVLFTPFSQKRPTQTTGCGRVLPKWVLEHTYNFQITTPFSLKCIVLVVARHTPSVPSRHFPVTHLSCPGTRVLMESFGELMLCSFTWCDSEVCVVCSEAPQHQQKMSSGRRS